MLETLRERTRQTPVGGELGTVRGWCREFGVTQPVIDRAMNALRREGLIETRRGSGIYVTDRAHRRAFGIFTGYDLFDPESGFFPHLLVGALRQAVMRRGGLLRYYFPANSANTMPDRLLTLRHDIESRQIEGIFSIAMYADVSDGLGVPAVGFDPDPNLQGSVRLDGNALVRYGLRALAERGCRRVAALIGGWSGNQPSCRRSFLRTARVLGLRTAPAWMPEIPQANGVTQATALSRRLFRDLWRSGDEKPDGLICMDDYFAAAVIEEMRALGLAPGRDLVIASQTNKGLDLFRGADAIRIEYDAAEIAGAMVRLMDLCLAGATEKTGALVRPARV